MPSKRKRQKVFIIALVTCFAAACVLIVASRRRAMDKSRVSSIKGAIMTFETKPSQAGADALAAIIDGQQATPEEAERILSLLFTPHVITRKSYPLGEAPMISSELRFNVRFRHMRVANSRAVWVNNTKQYGGSSSGGNSFNTSPQLLVLHPKPTEPGTYRMEIRRQYSAMARSKSVRGWTWRPFGRGLLPFRTTKIVAFKPPVDPNYKCEFVVPVDVVVVEKEKAERVTSISTPELDQAMRSAFISKARADVRYGYSTPTGRRECKGGLEVSYKDLPAAGVFQCVFRNADGGEVIENLHHLLREPIRLRANSSGSFFVRMSGFKLEQPGEYSGSIILRPDLEAAYKDPAIKSIWNSELSFPISFAVGVDE